MPAFLTANERELISNNPGEETGWIGTRFWFYPDSIEVESDNEMKYGRIVKPQFMADAERSRSDFGSPFEFEAKKKSMLSPSIRESIAQINSYYSNYETAYQEIRELTAVARLMGICSWIKRANYQNIDLDSLLSVELPEYRTERERTQLISSAYLPFSDDETLDEDYVKKNLRVNNLSPILDMLVKDYFRNTINIGKFLCVKSKIEENNYAIYLGEAKQIFNEYNNLKVRSIINSKEDLKALATYATNRIEPKSSPTFYYLESQLRNTKVELDSMKNELDQLEAAANKSATSERYNYYIAKYNDLVIRHETKRRTYNKLVDEKNRRSPLKVNFMMRISGGINLEHKYFNIKKVPNSPTLIKFTTITKKIDINWKTIPSEGAWIRNRAERSISYNNTIPKYRWQHVDYIKSGDIEYKYNTVDKASKYWLSNNKLSGKWRYSAEYGNKESCEKMIDPILKTLYVTTKMANGQEYGIIGEYINGNKIIFRQSLSNELILHKTPPSWWLDK